MLGESNNNSNFKDNNYLTRFNFKIKPEQNNYPQLSNMWDLSRVVRL